MDKYCATCHWYKPNERFADIGTCTNKYCSRYECPTTSEDDCPKWEEDGHEIQKP